MVEKNQAKKEVQEELAAVTVLEQREPGTGRENQVQEEIDAGKVLEHREPGSGRDICSYHT